MNLDYYVVDAFADEVFKGNPAAVYVLEEWLPEGTMQKLPLKTIYLKQHYSEENQEFELRWFTPDREIDLCGHATLATAFVLFNYYKIPDETIKFSTQSGNLFVTRIKDYYYMDFPSIMPKKCRYCLNMKKRLGLRLKKPT